MARKFQIKRGPKANLPTLAQGEFAMTTDSGSEGLHLGTGSKNLQIPILGSDGKLPSSTLPNASPTTHAASHKTGGSDPISPADIGAAASTHNHSASDINSGTLPVARGGTGNSSVDTTPTSGSTKMVTSGGVYTALNGKANTSHGNHVPTTETANNSRFLRNDNTWQAVTPANIGAAPSTHNHSAGDINSGTLASDRLPVVPITKGGTGANSAAAARSALGVPSTDEMNTAIANKKSAAVYTATIGTSWTENQDTGVKSQNVAISGVTASHTAKVDHSNASINGTSDGYAKFVDEENQYLTCITNGYAETYNGGITFYIFGDAPTVSIPIVVEVV